MAEHNLLTSFCLLILGSQCLSIYGQFGASRVSFMERLLAVQCPDRLAQLNVEQMKGELTGSAAQVDRDIYKTLMSTLIACRVGPELTPSQCRSATTLTDSWRLDRNGSNLRPGGPHSMDGHACDLHAGLQWFRFSGAGGKRLLDSCPKPYSCGSLYPYWSDNALPKEVGEVEEIEAYRVAGTDCKYDSIPLMVMRCSSDPNDVVYRTAVSYLSDKCVATFCGTN